MKNYGFDFDYDEFEDSGFEDTVRDELSHFGSSDDSETDDDTDELNFDYK